MKLFRNISVALVAGSMLLPAAPRAAGAVDLSPYPHIKPLIAPAHAAHNVGVFEIDRPILAATDPGFPNLRVVGPDARLTPHAVRMRRESRTVTDHRPVAMEKVGFTEQADNRIEVIFRRADSDDTRDVSRLRLETAQINFEKEVSIWGSHDRYEWALLTERQPVFDYTRFLDMRETTVTLTPSAHRYYRVEIANITESQRSPLTRITTDLRGGDVFSRVETETLRREDFRVDAFHFQHTTTRIVGDRLIERSYPVTNLVVETDAGAQVTHILFDAGRAPISRLILETPTPSFSRHAMVEGLRRRDGADAWDRLVSGTVRRIRMGHYEHGKGMLVLPRAARYDRYRITLRNQDSPPLEITGITAEGPVFDVVFAVTPDAVPRVFYGGPVTRAPSYDIAADLARVPLTGADRYTLGDRIANPRFAARPPWRLLDGRTAMITALLALTAVLVWAIIRTARRLDIDGDS